MDLLRAHFALYDTTPSTEEAFITEKKKNLKKKLFVKKFENVNKTNYFTPLFREMYLPSRLDTIDALKQ